MHGGDPRMREEHAAIVFTRARTPSGFRGRTRRPAGPLLFEGHRNIGVGGQANLRSFHARNEAQLDVVTMPLMEALATIALAELDPVADDAIDGADMYAVGADDLPTFLAIPL